MAAQTQYKVMQDLAGYFKPGEREAIYNACQNDRDRLLIRLLWKTGRRVSEILMVKIKDINFEDKMILWNIEKKKRDFRAWKPIDTETMDLLNVYVTKQGLEAESYLFPSNSSKGYLTRIRVYQILEKLCDGLEIYHVGTKKAHPHHFRHSFAIDKAKKLKSPADIRKLQQYLEHSNMGMTENYLQFGSQDLRSIVDD